MEQELPDDPSECVVCGKYIGGAGSREGRGPASKRCSDCCSEGKTPKGYKMKYGSMVPE